MLRDWTIINKLIYGHFTTRAPRTVRLRSSCRPMLQSSGCLCLSNFPNSHAPDLSYDKRPVTCDREPERVQQVNESDNYEGIEYPIIECAHTIGYPRAVMVIHTDARLTYLAMPWSLGFDYLVNYKSTPQSKQIRFGLFFINICIIPRCRSNCLSLPALDNTVPINSIATMVPKPINVP